MARIPTSFILIGALVLWGVANGFDDAGSFWPSIIFGFTTGALLTVVGARIDSKRRQ